MLEAENVQTSSAFSALDYNSIKEAYPDNIVLYQVGDFFEIYGEDARQAAELLEQLPDKLQETAARMWGAWKCAAFRRTSWRNM